MARIEKIDIEPKWEDLLTEFERIVGIHENPAELLELLRPAAHIADIVRQAQKEGCKTLTFEFYPKSKSFCHTKGPKFALEKEE